MTDKFVQVVETKTLKHVVDGDGPNCTYMSVVPDIYYPDSSVHIVIGARWEDYCAAHFSKGSLGELIDILKDIHSCLKD